MKIKLKIRQKILLYILSISALLYIVAIGYIVMSSREVISRDAIIKAQNITRISADKVEKIFEKELSLVRTLSQGLMVYKNMPQKQWESLFIDIYKPILKDNPQIFALWDSHEYSSYVPGYTKPFGRLAISIYREDNRILNITQEKSLTGDPVHYGAFKQKGVEGVWEPYQDQATTTKGIKMLVTFASPITVDGKFGGLIGTDVGLDNLQELVSKIKPVEGSFAFIVSNTGIVAGHPNEEYLNKNLKDIYPDVYDKEMIKEKVQKGEEFYIIRVDEFGKKQLTCFAPIIAGKIETPWSLVLSMPLAIITQEADRTLYVSLAVGIVGLLIIIITLIFISDRLTKPIRKITSSLKRMADGEISSDLLINIDTGDEIEEMSKALNISVEGLNNKAISAKNIGNGNYDTDINLLSDRDILGKSLIEMRDSLRNAHTEQENRRLEDQKRTWATEGFALFADIMRQNSGDIQELCDQLIRNIVKYVGANQGGIFLWNDEDKSDLHFNLMSAYAWDRKKYVTKRIEKGEGLVGACAMEKETILLNAVPNDYIDITSGLGGSTPRSVILVPLKNENEVAGVIEIASFNPIEKYQVEFLEKVGENIASTIASVKINVRTKALLEQSQQQAEEMAAQEEEMRQNMEELQATQEEAARRAGEVEGLISSLSASAYLVEYDLNGTIINVNDSYLNRLGVVRNQIIGKHHSDHVEMTEEQRSEYNRFWNDLRAGISQKQKTSINWDGRISNFIENYLPVFDGEGQVLKIMKLAYELEDFK